MEIVIGWDIVFYIILVILAILVLRHTYRHAHALYIPVQENSIDMILYYP